MNILLTQIGSMGDCLLTTAVARQIKEIDYPGCTLTWLIGDQFKSVLANNPHVDEIIEVPLEYTNDSIHSAMKKLPEHIEDLKRKGRKFDKVFSFDLHGSVKQGLLCFGTLRSTYFRIYHDLYGHRVTVSPEPVLRLTGEEVSNVQRFLRNSGLGNDDCFPILFECDPKSNQSVMTQASALAIAERLTREMPMVRCILSSKNPVKTGNDRILDGSVLTFRENAELLNHCRLLVGANSGITWLYASTWTKKIPMVQNVARDGTHDCVSYSVEMDYRYFGVPTSNLIELQDANNDELYACLHVILENSFEKAKEIYPERQGSVLDYFASLYSMRKLGYDAFFSRSVVTNGGGEKAAVEIQKAHCEMIRRHIPLGGKAILEVGCGNGDLARMIAGNYKSKSVVGIDPMLSSWWGVGESAGDNWRIMNGDAEELAFADNSFDAVISISTFEHIKNTKKALSEIKRVLKPFGRFYTTFCPLWTSVAGHHFFASGDTSWNPKHLRAIPPWGHLYMDEAEMREHLERESVEEKLIEEMISFIYRSTVINRRSRTELAGDFFGCGMILRHYKESLASNRMAMISGVSERNEMTPEILERIRVGKKYEESDLIIFGIETCLEKIGAIL